MTKAQNKNSKSDRNNIELVDMTLVELLTKAKELRSQILKTRLEVVARKQLNSSLINKFKKQLARVLTIINNKNASK